MTDQILLDVADRIATETINNPERRNAITFEMWHEIRRVLIDLKHDPEVRVIVFRGAGDVAFSAGADISEFEARRKNAAQATVYNAAFDAAMDEAEAVGKPTISMIKGACVGGGCEFSSALDLRVTADNGRFGVPIARLGLPIGHREMRRMTRLIGRANTMELLLTADLIDAERALQIGLVNHVRPLDEIEEFTYALAGKIAALAPVVHRVHKEIATRVSEDPSLESLTAEDAALAVSPYETEDFQEGWRSFLEKRTPEFHGR
jgi:enoyl-CoA hydratase